MTRESKQQEEDFYLSIAFSPKKKRYLEQLVEEGLWGPDMHTVMARLIDRQLQQFIEEGVFLEKEAREE